MIIAIKIRSSIGARQPVKDTLKMLNLSRKHSTVVLEDTPVNRGMLKKAKDFIAYGTVSEELAKQIQDFYKGDKAAHLHPPRGGYKSVKSAFAQGGDLGDRGEEMSALVKRMIP